VTTRTVYLTPSEAATILKISADTIRDYAKRGILPARKIGKHWRFLESDILPCSTSDQKSPAPTGGSVSRSRVRRSDSQVARIARNVRRRMKLE
jgi:excisionase family DNA binding protein